MGSDLDVVFEAIGGNVRRMREGRGWTQAHLAELAGVETSYLQKIEYGTARPSIATLVRVADAMETSFWSICTASRAANPSRRRGRPRKPTPDT